MKIMKKVLSLFLAVSIVLASANYIHAAGFVDNRNNTARLYNGFYYENIYLVMKWSKDWVPMAHQAPGAWLTNHFTWYTDDYSQDYYGYNVPNVYGTGLYRVEEFIKMKAIDDSLAASYPGNVIWGNILILTDEVTVYDTLTGEILFQTDVVQPLHPGLGNLKF